MRKTLSAVASLAICIAASTPASAQGPCANLPDHAALKTALTAARNAANGGFNLDMWATVVNRDGVVCAVAFTGGDRGDQWPGSRVISAQKANTTNAFSLPTLALSTANLYSAVQPGGATHLDNIIFDITPQPGQMPGNSASGFGHPHCGPGAPAGETALAAALPPTK